jgi:hypothetical protein
VPRYLLGISEDVTERKRRQEIEQVRLGQLEVQQSVLHNLVEHPSIHSGHPQEAFPVITENATRTFGVERASIWLFEDEQSRLVLQDLFEATTKQHTAGAALSVGEYPSYLRVGNRALLSSGA